MWFYAVLYKATLTQGDRNDVITSWNAVGVLAELGLHPCGRIENGKVVGSWS
jgi:hypothetical protein